MGESARRKLLFAALYLSEGAPIGFLWWLLPAHLRRAGVPVVEITALTAGLGVPWVFKFAWAPLLDTLRGRWWGYRNWMLLAQAVMGLALLPLAWLDLTADFGLVYALCLVHAFAAATQDVAIDAMAIATAPPEERGALNGWMQAGMLLGRAVFGGLALRVAVEWGMAPVVFGLCGVVWLVGVVAVFSGLAEAPLRASRGAAEHLAHFGRTLWRAFARVRTLWGIAFALLAGAGFEALGGVASPFLVDMQLSPEAHGNFFAFASVPAMVGGALLGGWASDRWGRARVCGGALMVLAVSIGLVAVVAAAGSRGALLVALGGAYLCIGLFTATSYALFMDLTEPEVAATQFTTFMAFTNACEVWSQRSVGLLIERWGYFASFAAMALVSLLAWPILQRLRERPADLQQ